LRGGAPSGPAGGTAAPDGPDADGEGTRRESQLQEPQEEGRPRRPGARALVRVRMPDEAARRRGRRRRRRGWERGDAGRRIRPRSAVGLHHRVHVRPRRRRLGPSLLEGRPPLRRGQDRRPPRPDGRGPRVSEAGAGSPPRPQVGVPRRRRAVRPGEPAVRRHGVGRVGHGDGAAGGGRDGPGPDQQETAAGRPGRAGGGPRRLDAAEAGRDAPPPMGGVAHRRRGRGGDGAQDPESTSDDDDEIELGLLKHTLFGVVSGMSTTKLCAPCGMLPGFAGGSRPAYDEKSWVTTSRLKRTDGMLVRHDPRRDPACRGVFAAGM
ncbi:hypothetical protein THAOC_03387, partial [Thalassiosira oceanica]